MHAETGLRVDSWWGAGGEVVTRLLTTAGRTLSQRLRVRVLRCTSGIYHALHAVRKLDEIVTSLSRTRVHGV